MSDRTRKREVGQVYRPSVVYGAPPNPTNPPQTFDLPRRTVGTTTTNRARTRIVRRPVPLPKPSTATTTTTAFNFEQPTLLPTGFTYRQPQPPPPASVQQREYIKRQEAERQLRQQQQQQQQQQEAMARQQQQQEMILRQQQAFEAEQRRQSQAAFFQRQAAEEAQRVFQQQQQQYQAEAAQRTAQLQQQKQLQQQQFEAEQKLAQKRAYLSEQARLNIPDVLFVQVGNEEVQVMRNDEFYDTFWVDGKNSSKGVGQLVYGPNNQYMFKWVRPDQTSQRIAKLMETPGAVFTTPYYKRGAPPPTQTVVNTPPSKKTVSPPAPASIQQLKSATASDELDISISPSLLQSSLESRKADLEKREKELSRLLALPKATMERQQDLLRQETEVEKARLEFLYERRMLQEARLREEKRERLSEEVGRFKSQRAEELDSEAKKRLEQLNREETEQSVKLKKLRKTLEDVNSGAALEKASEELTLVRSKIQESQRKAQRTQAVTELTALINRRFFSPEASRARTFVEMISLFPKVGPIVGNKPVQSFQDYVLSQQLPTKNGVPIDPEEDRLTTEEQREFITAVLCGSKKLGYTPQVLKLTASDCQIK